jgi:hypothetical protein
MYGYTYGYPSGGGAGAVNGFESAVLSDGGTVVAIGNTNDLYSRLLGLGLINSASLVNSCNGGKADALYNFVPSPVQALDRFVVTRASTKLRIGSNGLYGSVANNVPAFEFNTDGTYRGLLVEPGATNLLLRSQELDTASWGKTTSSVTGNAGVSPDGTTTADKLIPSNGSSGFTNQLVAIANATVYTFSVFAKQAEYRYIQLNGDSTSARIPASAYFDLQTGVISQTDSGTARIENVGNGWYRCSVTATSTSTEARPFFRPSANGTSPVTGDGTSGVFLWQAQLETGSVATSPIVTTAGTASRVADVVSLTGASSLIGQTEGTIFAEVDTRVTGGASLDKRILSLSDGTTGLLIELSKTITDELKARVVNTTEQASIVTATNRTGVFKLALAYAVNDIAFYVNGVQIGTDALATIPACSAINIGSRVDVNAGTFFNDRIRSVALFPTRLANATLASLTA